MLTILRQFEQKTLHGILLLILMVYQHYSENLMNIFNIFIIVRLEFFLFTNGLIFKQSVYDGLINGAVRWAIVSLDAGTKSTYKKMKLSPKFDVVLENIARYSEAGSKGGGNCAVKYIFHEDNSNDDDLLGFCYAMLALRPQEVWLTFDSTLFAISQRTAMTWVVTTTALT